MNRAVPTISESAEDLKRLLKAESDSRRAQRLHMLYLFASQQVKTRKDAAAMLGVHRETVGAWLDRYAAGGYDAMLEVHVAPGKAPSLTPEVETALRAALSRPTGFASYGEIVDWLWQQHGIRLAYSTVHTLVRYKLKARPKVARRSNREKKRVRLRPSKPTSSNGSATPFPPPTTSP
jgi:transposase